MELNTFISLIQHLALEKVIISIKQTFECIKVLDLYINCYTKFGEIW
jgi:hypothetical protein